jgi:hypothetical protein
MERLKENKILNLISHKKYYLQIKKELLNRIQRREIVKLRRKKEFNEDEEYIPTKEDLISTGRAILKSGGKVAKEFHLIIQNALKLFEFKVKKENLNFPEQNKNLILKYEKRRLENLEMIKALNRNYIEFVNKEFNSRKEKYTKSKNSNNNQICNLIYKIL